jgi:hypothetical protein
MSTDATSLDARPRGFHFALLAAMVVVIAAPVTEARSAPAAGSPTTALHARVRTLTGHQQAHFGDADLWCGRFVHAPNVVPPAAECAPWDGIRVGFTLDKPDLTPGIFPPTPLELGSLDRARLITTTATPRATRIYAFSFGPSVHTPHPFSISIPSDTAVRFAKSAWQCGPVPNGLSCYRVQAGRRTLPTILVLPKQRLVEVKTSTTPDLLSGPVGNPPRSRTSGAEYLYEFDR